MKQVCISEIYSLIQSNLKITTNVYNKISACIASLAHLYQKKMIILEDDVIKSKSVTELFNTEKNCKEY